jgi:thiosulfate reductase cytochrome b subunit
MRIRRYFLKSLSDVILNGAKKPHSRLLIFCLALIILVASGAFAVYRVYARLHAMPLQQASPLHPTFALLDQENQNVLTSGAPVSTIQTCGQCHDTKFIINHSFHADLGHNSQADSSQAPSQRPWDFSAGFFGKWSPLTYRYISQPGDSRPDLDSQEWVTFFANRLTGGDPAKTSGLEMNCFLCHLTQPNNPERIEAIRRGETIWASTATLMGTGIVAADGSKYRFNPAAFTGSGELDQSFVTIQDPATHHCAQCHGLAQTDSEQPLTLVGCSLENAETAVTGQVIAAQQISLSGMNLADKAQQTHAWDIHAERGLKCTDCHYSLNNPAYYQANSDDRPAHLQYDPRRLEIGEYLQKPDHNFARGQSAQQYTFNQETEGAMRRCEACHVTTAHAEWLPYAERHLSELSCETCHIPRLAAPAIESIDWTVLQADGAPVTVCRGVEGDSRSINSLINGYQPVLLQRENRDGSKYLAPYNLVTAWFWVYQDANGLRPVRQEDLLAVYFENGQYAPAVLQAFDDNQDSQISQTELRLDTPEKKTAIVNRLVALGLHEPRILGEIQPYSINHNVVSGDLAIRECQECHADDSRLAASTQLTGYLPAGILPEFVKDTNTIMSTGSSLTVQNGSLVYSPLIAEYGMYILGHNRVPWIDWLGGLFFVVVLTGVAGHSTLRFISTSRRPRQHNAVKLVYMYQVYERFWHWLQTFVIVLLLFTGLIIHRPDIFGWLSFRHIVTIHNVLAAILVINAMFSLFYHLVSGEIRQFIPRPYGFFDQAIVQAKFYLQGIFHGEPHPFEKTPSRKMNPLQQVTYFGILNILLPLQIITGALMWGAQRWPEFTQALGGLPFLAPFHSLVAWIFGSFIIGHVYLTTTGHKPLTGIKAMIHGWEESVIHISEDQACLDDPEVRPNRGDEDQTQTAAADY